MKTYNSFKTTALVRGSSMSVPVRTLVKKGILAEGKSILDFGCGHGESKAQLPNLNIALYDKFNDQFADVAALNNEYDIVICNYVFNVIPTLDEHAETLNNLRKLGKEVYISVRADVKAVSEKWVFDPANETYFTGRSTQRLYDEDMVARLFGEVEYIVSNQSLKLFRIKEVA